MGGRPADVVRGARARDRATARRGTVEEGTGSEKGEAPRVVLLLLAAWDDDDDRNLDANMVRPVSMGVS